MEGETDHELSRKVEMLATLFGLVTK